MPPRYAYWTILIDHKPTAFRARERDDLVPTFNQLRRTNTDVVLKWFGRGKLWDSPEAEREASAAPPPREKRGHDWRPGGVHKDPRDRFKKGAKRRGAPGGSQPWRNTPRSAAPAGSQPWRDKPRGPASGGGAPSWRDKPRGAAPAGSQPWRDKPRGHASGGSQSWRDKPRGAASGGSHEWRDKPRSADVKRRDDSTPQQPPDQQPRAKKPGPPDRD